METIRKCESCGADLVADNNMAFCPYCGTKVSLTESHEVTINKNINNHYVDEANVIKAKKEVIESKNKLTMFIIGILVGLLIIATPFIIIAIEKKKEEDKINDYLSKGYMQIEFRDEDFKGEDYAIVKSQLVAAGFTNIELVDVDDWFGELLSKGKVKSVSIAGDSDYRKGDWFNPNDKIIITYY